MTTRICIAYPSSDYVHVKFVKSLLDLITYTNLAAGERLSMGLANQISSRIADNRNVLVDMARAQNATHILFIDSDMTFPANGLMELLGQDKDIMGATASKRQEGDRNPIGVVADPGDMITNKRFVKMAILGLPFMLIKMSVFDKLKKPYFAEPIDGESLIPEDSYFCKTALEAGFDIWCDMGLSVNMGHMGTKEYKIEEAAPARRQPLHIVEAA